MLCHCRCRSEALQKAAELLEVEGGGQISHDDEDEYDATIYSAYGVAEGVRTLLVVTEKDSHTIFYF